MGIKQVCVLLASIGVMTLGLGINAADCKVYVTNNTKGNLCIGTNSIAAGDKLAIDLSLGQNDSKLIGQVKYDDKAVDAYLWTYTGTDESDWENYIACSSKARNHSWQFKMKFAWFKWGSGPSTWPASQIMVLGIESKSKDYMYDGFDPSPGATDDFQDVQKCTGSLQGLRNVSPLSFKWSMALFEPGNDNPHTMDYNLSISELPANTTVFDRIVVFGDSLSDNHNLFDLSSGNLGRGTYYNGRFSNGPNWVDQLQLKLGCPVLNYAVASAEVLRDCSANRGFAATRAAKFPMVPSLANQISHYQQRISDDISTNKERILFVFLMGGNDFHAWLIGHTQPTGVGKYKARGYSGSIHDAKTLARLVADQMVTDLGTLADKCGTLAGAGNKAAFLVINLPDMSDTRAFSSLLDIGSTYSNIMNDEIKTKVALETKKKNDVKVFNLNGALTYLLDNPKTFGYISADSSTDTAIKANRKKLIATSIWGTDKDEDYYNSSNFMGYGTYSVGGPFSTGSYTLSNYGGENVNQCITADFIHPTAKSHDLISNELIYFFYNQQWLKPNPGTEIVNTIISAQGINMKKTGNKADCTVLLNRAETQTQPRPDFASNYDSN